MASTPTEAAFCVECCPMGLVLTQSQGSLRCTRGHCRTDMSCVVLVNVLDDVLHTAVETNRTPSLVANRTEEGVAVMLNFEQQRLIAEDARRPRSVLTRPRPATALFAKTPFKRREEIEIMPLAATEELVHQRRLDQILAKIVIQCAICILKDAR